MTDQVSASPDRLPFPLVPRRVYNNDPIQEALCEIRFRAPRDGWAVMPGQLYERLQHEYPAEPIQEGLQGGVPSPPPPTLLPVQIMIGAGMIGRVRLSDASGRRLVFATPHVLTVNSMQPYEGWEAFSSRITRLLNAFSDIVHGVFDVERIGLRYVNRLDVPSSELRRYFDVRPLHFDNLPLSDRSFLCRSELAVPDDPSTMMIATFILGPVFSPILGPLPPAETPAPADQGWAFILDLDAISQNLEGVNNATSVVDIVHRLRIIEKSAFEAAITEEARNEVFGGYRVVEA